MTDKPEQLRQELERQAETIRVLQNELSETNQGLVALSMELEQRVDERTTELQAAQSELKRTNSELLMLTMELEDRVTQRTEELSRTLTTLRETEDRTDFALGATHIGTWDLNLEDGSVQRSDVFDQIFGYDKPLEQWTYPLFLEHVLPEDREKVDRSYRAMLETDKDWDFECRIRCRNGQIRWISGHGRLRADGPNGQKNLVGIIQNISERKQAELERETALGQLKKTLEGSIKAIARTIETRDPYTAGHQERVAQLAQAIAVELGLDEARIEGLGFGGLIHDIGKISVPAELLSTPRRLRPLEMELIRGHAQVGYDIIKDIDFPWPVGDMILQHHERLDGSGYPQGLKDPEILYEAKILSVADVVEAMSSHRPYRPGFGIDVALEHIRESRGTLYDAKAVDACLLLFRDKGFTFKTAF